MFARIMTITYPVSIENIDGTTSSKALQSSLLTQFNTILYSISRVKDTNVKEQAAAHGALELCFTVIIQPITQNTALIIPNMIHIKFSSKSRFVVALLYTRFLQNESDFLCFLFIKAELEQCGNKPGFYAVLGIPVNMPVLNGGNSDTFAVMPQNLVHGFRLSAGRPDNRFIG